MAHATSTFIDSLPADDRSWLLSRLDPVLLMQHRVLFDVHDTIRHVYFPIDAVVSLVLPLSTGQVVETAMAGCDGMVGAPAALDGRLSLHRAIVQIGGKGLRCEVQTLRDLAKEHPSFRETIISHEQALLAQTQQSAACNLTHTIERRLARWLLRASDLHGSKQLELTQEFLAEMLGVRRTSVSMIAHGLQERGLIRYRRGHISLENIDGLRELACECYQAVKMNYQSVLHEHAH
jgi:CRP-like cAMP-binding protein